MSGIELWKPSISIFRFIARRILSASDRRFASFLDFRRTIFEDFVSLPTKDDRKIQIIVAETYPQLPSNEGKTCGGLRATGEGQIFALFYLLPFLTRIYGFENLELKFADRSRHITKDEYTKAREQNKLVIIGGPINNNWARAVHEFENPRYNFGETEKTPNPHSLHDRRHPINIQDPGQNAEIGLLVQLPSKRGKGFDVLYLAGQTTKGTAGIAKAISVPRILKKVQKQADAYSLKSHGRCFRIKTLGHSANDQEVDIQECELGNINEISSPIRSLPKQISEKL